MEATGGLALGATELSGAVIMVVIGLATLTYFLKPSKKKGTLRVKSCKLPRAATIATDDEDGYHSDPGNPSRTPKVQKFPSLPVQTSKMLRYRRTKHQRESGMKFSSVPEPTWQDPVTPWTAVRDDEEKKDKSVADKAMLRLLQRVEAFGCLDDASLEVLCETAKITTWKAGQHLCKLNDPAQVPTLYVVWSGSFVSVDESGMVLRKTEAGKGLTSMLDLLAVLVHFEVQPCATIIAEEDSEILEVPLKSLIEDNPSAIVEMTRIIFMHFSRVTLDTLLRSCGLSNNFWRARGNTPKPKDTPLACAAAALGVAESVLASLTLELEPTEISEDTMQVVKMNPGKKMIAVSQFPAIYVVLSGELVVSREDTGAVLSTVSAGRSVGQLELLAGTWSYWYGTGFYGVPFISVRALSDGQTEVVRIPLSCCTKLLASHPQIAFSAASKILNLVSMTVRQYDHSLECCRLGPGERYVEEGTICTHQGIVIHGRLRGIKKGQVVCEFGRGMRIGSSFQPIKAGQTGDEGPEHNFSVLAVREALVVCVPCVVLDAVAERFPEVRKHLFNEMARRLLDLEKNPNSENQKSLMPSDVVVGSTPLNSINVAVIPITADVPMEAFCYRLKETLSDIKGASTDSNILWVRSDVLIQEKLKTYSEAGLRHWISHQEEMHHVMLFEGDDGPTTWTKICVHSADMILLVGNAAVADGTSAPPMQNLEAIRGRTNAQIELVMVHVDPVSPPEGTRHWIRALPEVVKHHHMRLYSQDLEHDCTSFRSDFKRLARWITGTSVGIVFSGGGARGNCIPGAIRAMEELEVPIDIVSGTSIGAMYGGLWCHSTNLAKLAYKGQQFSKHMGNTLLMALTDITWPRVSLLCGRYINRGLYNIFKERRIEDLWIPYLCITTDLHSSAEAVHKSGTLWRYCRASMSLTGFLPPITDVDIVKDSVTGQTVENVRYLVDGGYTNNLPADVVRNIGGARILLAFDVSQPWTFSGYHYGDWLSGFWQLFRRWFWPLPTPIPSQADINSRLAYIGSVGKESIAQKTCDLYIRPSMDGIKTLDWHKFKDTEVEGYQCTMRDLQHWKQTLQQKNDFRWRLLFGAGGGNNEPVAFNRSRSL